VDCQDDPDPQDRQDRHDRQDRQDRQDRHDRHGNNARFDFDALVATAGVLTRNLNRVIDRTYYPHPYAKASNLRHRPIGIGVQGLADVYAMMGLPFDSDGARALNRDIFAAIYYGSMRASVDLAREEAAELRGSDPRPWPGAYTTFEGSPLSEGKFQFDLWGVEPCATYDWDALRRDVLAYGARNSLLVAPMPTASTSQIMGNTECFEPVTSNIYKRKTMAGEYIVVNRHLVAQLQRLGLWDTDMRDAIVTAQGSVQGIERIPSAIRDVFKTSWDISMRAVIDQAADRAPYVCQSQSMSLFMGDPNFRKMSSMLFYAWERGLKTGMYYLRTKTKARAQQFTIKPQQQQQSDDDQTRVHEQSDDDQTRVHDDQQQQQLCEACSA
jgi:ribonucleoside-diphosphate reductase alpha chain